MTWNIEQFGNLRTSNIDNMAAVARIINTANPVPDIIVLLEIKSSKPKEVCFIAKSISDWIYEMSNQSKRYNYIISFYNDLESYVYLYLQGSITPLTLANGVDKIYDDDPNSSYAKISDLNFITSSGVSSTVSGNNDNIIIKNSFPLLDYKNRNTRCPAAGFFVYNNKIIGIVGWHNKSGNNYISKKNMIDMSKSWFVTNKKLRIKHNNNQIDVENILITGDFNYDICESDKINTYKAFSGFTTHINGKTILEQYSYWNKYSNEDSILSAGFDNHIYCFPNNGISVNKAYVCNVPKWYLQTVPIETCNILSQSNFIYSQYSNSKDDEEIVYQRFMKYLKDKLKKMSSKDSPNMSNTEIKEIISECVKIVPLIRTSENMDQRLKKTKNILGIYFDAFSYDVLKYYISPSMFKGYRYALIKDNPKYNMNWGDVLFLYRQFASDHLPVIIEFN